MKLAGGDFNVSSGVAFRGADPLPMVRLLAKTEDGEPLEFYVSPADARKIGLDLIGAAHSSVADSMLRVIAQEFGIDGDGLIDRLRQLTDAVLPE